MEADLGGGIIQSIRGDAYGEKDQEKRDHPLSKRPESVESRHGGINHRVRGSSPRWGARKKGPFRKERAFLQVVTCRFGFIFCKVRETVDIIADTHPILTDAFNNTMILHTI